MSTSVIPPTTSVAPPALGGTRSSGHGPRRNPVLRGLFYLILIVLAFYLLFPFYWAIRSALIPESAAGNTPVEYWPSDATLSNFGDALTGNILKQPLINSAIVAGSVTLLSLVIGASAAYALGRIQFRGRTIMMYAILSMTIFPQIAILGALYTQFSKWGLINSEWSLIISYLIFTLPFTIWVLQSFFRTMPRELEESAYVDGASPFRTFWSIMLPLAAPGLVTTGLLAFINAWNEYLYAVSFLQTADHFTVPVAIVEWPPSTGSQFAVPWDHVMAGTVIVTVPLIVLVLIFQRRLVAGLTAGAVKG
ncbi:MAG TPA: carbohydrate ABC transporter permease [Chloroflexota bacterium]|nr:carbohydrate ABC transporter permease [Chloroflexota bacterium]